MQGPLSDLIFSKPITPLYRLYMKYWMYLLFINHQIRPQSATQGLTWSCQSRPPPSVDNSAQSMLSTHFSLYWLRLGNLRSLTIIVARPNYRTWSALQLKCQEGLQIFQQSSRLRPGNQQLVQLLNVLVLFSSICSCDYYVNINKIV